MLVKNQKISRKLGTGSTHLECKYYRLLTNDYMTDYRAEYLFKVNVVTA